MGEIHPPEPVKYIAGLLLPGEGELEAVCRELAPLLGRVSLTSAVVPFDYTDYYHREMGSLVRVFVAFDAVRQPGELARVKRAAMAIEDCWRRADGGRRVNIDPGYLSLSQLVLASMKPFSHRIYLDDGVYGEVTLLYRDGSFQALPWTYPDYQAHIPLFNEWREVLKSQRRAPAQTSNARASPG